MCGNRDMDGNSKMVSITDG
jgi:hypothetical protein